MYFNGQGELGVVILRKLIKQVFDLGRVVIVREQLVLEVPVVEGLPLMVDIEVVANTPVAVHIHKVVASMEGSLQAIMKGILVIAEVGKLAAIKDKLAAVGDIEEGTTDHPEDIRAGIAMEDTRVDIALGVAGNLEEETTGTIHMGQVVDINRQILGLRITELQIAAQMLELNHIQGVDLAL